MRGQIALSWSLLASGAVWSALRLPGGAWWALAIYNVGCLWAGHALGGASARQRLAPSPFLVASSLGAAAGAVVLSVALPSWPWAEATATWRRWGLLPPWRALWLGYFVLVNPYVEERYWRVALLGEQSRRFLSVSATQILSIVPFTLYHIVVLIPSFGRHAIVPSLGVLMAAIVWVWWYETRRDFWGVVVSHMSINAALVGMYLLQDLQA